MPSIIPITDFRKNIFDYATQILAQNQEVEIERNGQRILRIAPIKDDPSERAKYLLKYVLPKLAGIWKDVPQKEFDKTNEYLRGKKAQKYLDNKKFKW